MSEICVIGVYVRDINKARRFYCDLLGFKVTREYGDCILQLENKGVTFVIEQIEGDIPAEPCIVIGTPVKDLAQEMERLRDQGVILLHNTPQPFPAGIYAAFQDPDGNLLELIQFQEQTE